MKRIISFLPWLGTLLLIGIIMLYYESDLLWKVEQNNLFLYTPLYFHERMMVSGGFLSYISCYFTQYFYHPWLGVLILCSWWFLLMWLSKRTFHISDRWAMIALIPVAILLVTNMSLGYWHYFMRLQGYFYVPTIGTTIGIGMLWIFRILKKHLWICLCWIVLATAIGYPLFGVYALAAVLLMAVWTWRLSDNRMHNALLTGVALICIVAIPLICYRHIYYQTFIADIWTTALPITNFLETKPAYYIPYYILVCFFLLMVLAYPRVPSSKSLKPIHYWGAQVVLLVCLALMVWLFWYKGDNFHHELVMQHYIEESDWEGVVSEGKKQDVEPTRTIIMFNNLALSRLGRQPDEMYNFPWGRQKGDSHIPYDILNVIFSRTIFYQYGLLNDCHRKCVEDGVEFGWKVETLKYLVRCSILSGEKRAAQKILDKLRQTKYYCNWANRMQQLLEKTELRAEDCEMSPITHMLQYKDALGLDQNDVEKYVMTILAYQDANDPYFQEQAVLAALWKRNPQLFWARFNHYVQLYPQGPIPRIFQEAGVLFTHMAHRPIEKMSFDKGVIDNYNAFMKEAKKYNGQQAIAGRTMLYPFFGNTYYFYYYFLQDMK